MSNLQAFALCCTILLIQCFILLMTGFKLGKDYTLFAFVLFIITDFCLCAAADILKVVKKGDLK